MSHKQLQWHHHRHVAAIAIGLSHTALGLVQVIYTRRPDQGQQLCSSGQLPGAKAVSTIKELLQACKASSICCMVCPQHILVVE